MKNAARFAVVSVVSAISIGMAHAGSGGRTPYIVAPLFPRCKTMASNREPDDGRGKVLLGVLRQIPPGLLRGHFAFPQ